MSKTEFTASPVRRALGYAGPAEGRRSVCPCAGVRGRRQGESATMITLWPLCARPGCLCFVPQRGQTCRWCHERFQRSTEAIFAKWDELFRRLAK